ncbi:MAG TPA: glycoside hydrolase family 95 protein [Candidatus Bathyarchaeia archaeon]|nr:glycoside hydrolase family 95 protein [Candidatus Bathyarchaeia archaeon]
MMRTLWVLSAGILMGLQGYSAAEEPSGNPLVLWYRQPASRWMESLPVGNGRLGAMVFGGVDCERIALNESTLWSGEPGVHENPGTQERLAEIRGALFEGRYAEAQGMCRRYVLGRRNNYGTHLPMGNLLLRFADTGNDIGEYRRELDLDQAVARVAYTVRGTRYEREILCSNVDQVLVLRMTSSTPGQLSFEVVIDGGENPSEVRAEGTDTLVVTGHAYENKHSNGQCGVGFRGQVKLVASGGKVTASDKTLQVEHADSAILFVAINTDFGGRDPGALCQAQLDAAAKKGYDQIRDAHVADHQHLFHRVDLDLGTTDAAALPTDQRLERLRAGRDDPQLVTTFFQYGRYLLIAGSRENSPLPTNLQGIWNDNLACKMGWTCDFHLDINTQQNYWPAEVCNLSECHEPLFDFIESLRAPGRKTARETYGCPGWVCHTVTNAWGYTALGWGLTWGGHVTAGVWLASHLWEHYLFTGDQAFLAQRAYPVLKEAAEFFLDYMVEHPRYHYLVTGPSPSPENAFIAPDGSRASESMGPTCDTVLVRDLFSHCIEASHILGTDAEFTAKLEKALAKLPPLQIGKHGQLQEWLEDFEDAIPNHRHMSHLIALFPSDQIAPNTTPELAHAARVTIERRINRPDWEDVEWSRGNLINFYARLGDGEMAHDSVLGLLRKLTDTNLLTFSVGGIAGAPQNIFVIDGNSSGTAGIAEMLLQSHGGEINLLPALPRAWPNGRVTGLRARGGYEVDIAWNEGRLTGSTIRATIGGTCRIRTPLPVQIKTTGRETPVQRPEPTVVELPVSAGDTLCIAAAG